MNPMQEHRIEALEAAYGKAHPEEANYLQEAERLTIEAIKQLEKLDVLMEVCADPLAKMLLENLNRLRWVASTGANSDAFVVWWSLRWPAALVDFLARTPTDLRPDVVRALAQPSRGPTWYWLFHFACGQSQLPDNLSAGVMRDLLSICLRKVDWQSLSMTCESCKLERPSREPARPDFFAACPHCGNSAWTWTHLRSESEANGGAVTSPTKQAK
jgi:hypothetical protein